MKYILIVLLSGSFAYAADSNLKTACGSDIGKLAKEDIKNCSDNQSDKAIFECVEHHEKKVSKLCYDAHEDFEKQSGTKDND